MEQRIMGEWIKYEEEKGKIITDKETSYYRLYQDVKNSDTLWPITSLERCFDDLRGDMMTGLGMSGDIYVYYEINSETKERKPLMYFMANNSVVEKGTKFVEVYGRNLPIDNEENRNFNVEPRLIPVLIDKLREIKAMSRIITEFEDKEKSYKELERIKNNGAKTEDDILTIYQNFHRRDTTLVYELVNGRNIEDDFNFLSPENKAKLIVILCKMNSITEYGFPSILPLTRLKRMNSKGENEKLLDISDKDILIATANDTKLKCLGFASDALLKDKSFIMEMVSMLKLIGGDYIETYIPDEFKLDLDILQMATRSNPFELQQIIGNYRYNEILKEKIDKLFSDREYARKLIEYHFKNVLSNPKYVEELFTAPKLIWHFDPEILENIENTILWGPEPTRKREILRQKIYWNIKSTREEIKEFIRKREK